MGRLWGLTKGFRVVAAIARLFIAITTFGFQLLSTYIYLRVKIGLNKWRFRRTVRKYFDGETVDRLTKVYGDSLDTIFRSFLEYGLEGEN